MTYLAVGIGILISFVGFLVTYLITPKLIRYQIAKRLTVPDINKKDRPQIPRYGGFSIVAGLLASELIMLIIFPQIEIMAVIITTSLAFVIGYIDDIKVMGGWFKPLTLMGASLPILLLGSYDADLTIPLFGEVEINILYLGLVVLIIPIMGNTINSIDVMNGVASGFMAISGFTLTLVLVILENYQVAMMSLPLGFISLAFYKYHKYPSRTFLGDSGTLALGAMYGVLVIVGGVEMLGAIIILPAILNSFLFLSSMKKIVEHRQIKDKPVEHTEDMKLKATDHIKAPVTLVRLILGSKTLSEQQIGFQIFKLAILCSGLAIITAIIMRMMS